MVSASTELRSMEVLIKYATSTCDGDWYMWSSTAVCYRDLGPCTDAPSLHWYWLLPESLFHSFRYVLNVSQLDRFMKPHLICMAIMILWALCLVHPISFTMYFAISFTSTHSGSCSNNTKERILGNVKGKLHKKYSFIKSRLCQSNVAVFLGNNCITDFLGKRNTVDPIDLDYGFHII